MFVGGFLSAALAGRLRRGVERGAGVTVRSRLATAVAGGAIMGVGAVLARGCTSGQALTGGALLSVGSWAFMISAFAAGYAVAPMVKAVMALSDLLVAVGDRRRVRVRARARRPRQRAQADGPVLPHRPHRRSR